MSKIIDYFYESVIDPYKHNKVLPFWVHLVLKIILQLIIGYLTVLFWFKEIYFISIIFGIIFIYLISIIIFAEQIRKFVTKLI